MWALGAVHLQYIYFLVNAAAAVPQNKPSSLSLFEARFAACCQYYLVRFYNMHHRLSPCTMLGQVAGLLWTGRCHSCGAACLLVVSLGSALIAKGRVEPSLERAISPTRHMRPRKHIVCSAAIHGGPVSPRAAACHAAGSCHMAFAFLPRHPPGGGWTGGVPRGTDCPH